MMIYNFYTVGNMRREARKEDKLGLEAYITAPGGLRYSILTVALGWVDSRCIVSSLSRRNAKRRMGRKLRKSGADRLCQETL